MPKTAKFKDFTYFFALILLISTPFIKHRKIFTSPTITNGSYNQSFEHLACNVYYTVNNKKYILHADAEYLTSNPISIICNKNSPENAIIFSFSYLYLQKFMTLPFFLFFIISVFYFSIKNRI